MVLQDVKVLQWRQPFSFSLSLNLLNDFATIVDSQNRAKRLNYRSHDDRAELSCGLTQQIVRADQESHGEQREERHF